ncbi:MAG: hypothetical protein K2N48_13320 [Muribaculaceae bacterium]|nr:hypothetical protein [Muribaculaceae bacterium]
MGKTERHQKLRDRNLRKAKEIHETSGRLIEENHNGQDYSPEYAQRVVAWRFFELWMKTRKYKNRPEELWAWFGRLREGLQTLLLHWPDGNLGRGAEFWLIYELLGYWRSGNKEELTQKLYKVFGDVR